MNTSRNPQLALRLDSPPPDPAERWHAGVRIAYLGGFAILRLDTDRSTPVLDGNILHMPLPPAATPRQIQDGVEAWLRQEAERLIDASVMRHARKYERSAPRWTLSFATRGSWMQTGRDGLLRFNWRLVEQSVTLIDQVVGRAIAALPAPGFTADLWGMRAT